LFVASDTDIYASTTIGLAVASVVASRRKRRARHYAGNYAGHEAASFVLVDHVAEVIDSDGDGDGEDFVMSDPDFFDDGEERPGDRSFF